MLTFTPTYGKTTFPIELYQKYWARHCYEAGIKENYFNKFMGRDSRSIIHVKEELNKGPGTSINIPLRMPLFGAGVIEDKRLEDKEEALTFRSFDVYLHQIRHATRIEGRYEEQKSQQNLRTHSRQALTDWIAQYVENSIFAVATGVKPDWINTAAGDEFPFELEPPTRVMFAGAATNEQAITPADTFDTNMIGKAKRMARANKVTALRPIRVDGRETYVMVIDQYQARDLRRDPKWLEAQQHANIRGEENPIFSGAMGIYDGVVIHESLNVPRTDSGAGSTFNATEGRWEGGAMVGHALFLGAQAIVFAEGEAPRWDQETFDYGNQWGIAVGRMLGLKRSSFKFDGTNPLDYGMINIMTSSEDD